MPRFAAFYASIVVLALNACGAHTTGGVPAQTPQTPGARPSSNQLPIDSDDGSWGDPLAPVTLVLFTDLQCPFCARGHELVHELQRRYGAQQLRVVIKHVPLNGHAGAIPAARVAQAVLALGGSAKFFEYLDRAFAAQDRVASGAALDLALPLGIDIHALSDRAGSAAVGQQVLADTVLAEQLAIEALPHFRVNGRPFTGVYPVEALASAVDAELAEARRLSSSGVPAQQIYSRRVSLNIDLPEP